MLLSTQNIDKSQVKYRRRTLYFSADGRHARLILSCHVARRSNDYFVKNLTVALSVNLSIIFVAFQYFLNLILIIFCLSLVGLPNSAIFS